MTTPSNKRDKSKDLALVGTVIAGKYRVLELLGQGGFGSVFLVEIIAGMVGEKLALKLIPADLSGDEKVKSQFLNEIRVAMRMVNKYIVQIRDVGQTDDGQLYYTMDYCPGETLASVLRREGKLPPLRAIPITLRILEALKTAHGAGVIHRDLKPANVMVFQQDSHETVRVLDFGIATVISAGRNSGSSFVGSPHYMPPEQFLNEELGYYTDTYSVGVILYETLTGQKPYPGRTPQEVYNELKRRPVVPPEQVNPQLAAYPGLTAVIIRSLERNPDLRYPSAKDLFNDLKAILEGRADAGAPAGGAAVAGGGEGAVRRGPSAPPAVRASRARIAGRSSQKSLAPGIAIAAGVAVLGIIVAVFFLQNGKPRPEAQPAVNQTLGSPKVAVDGNSSPRPPDSQPPVPVNPDPGPVSKSTTPKVPPPEIKSQAQPVVASKAATPDPVTARRDAVERARQRIAQAIDEAKAERWDKVREVCQDVIALDAENVDAQRLKGQAELKLGMFDDAKASLEKARARSPSERVDANLILFLIEAEKGRPGSNPDELLRLLKEGTQAYLLEPPGPEATAKLLTLLEERGCEPEILQVLESARSHNVSHAVVDRLHQKYLVDLPKEREGQALEVLKDAKKLLQDRDLVKAAEKAEEGMRLRPLPELGFVLAESRLLLGKERDARAALGSMGERVGENSEGLARLGILYGRSYLVSHEKNPKKGGDLEKAIDNFNAVLEVLKDPKVKDPFLQASALSYRARCWAHEAKLEKVDEDLKAAAALHDRDLTTIYHQAESYFVLGDKAQDPDRSAAFQRSIQRLAWYQNFKEAAKEPQGFFLKGLCYLRMGGKKDNFDKAIDNFSKAQRFGLKDQPLFFEFWAEAYLGLGDQMKAGQKYRDGFEAKPSAELCLKAANCFLEANSKVSAESVLRAGLARWPKNGDIQSMLQRVSR